MLFLQQKTFYLLYVRVTLTAVIYDKGCSRTKTFLDLQNSTFFIGGMVPAHRLDKDKNYILNRPGIYWASAIAYAVQEINKNSTLLPNVRLGFDIRDTRNEVLCASKHALDFLFGDSKHSTLVGVVGPASSSLSAAVSSILLPKFIPQVSYSSTSNDLSRPIYRNFLRTCPPDNFQAEAIIDLMKHFKWECVSLFASDDDYGHFGQEELKKVAKEKKVCFVTYEMFKENIDLLELNEVIKKVKNDSVVILWCGEYDATKIIRKSLDCGLQNITWIGTEQWASSFKIDQLSVNRLSHTILCLHLEHQTIQNLEKEIRSAEMPSSINSKNPWYCEYLDPNFSPVCPKATSIANILPNKKQAQVVAAVYALAYGLHDYLNCTSTECSARVHKVNYKVLYNRILKTTFTIPASNFSMKFNSSGQVVSPSYEYVVWFNNSFQKFGSWKSLHGINIDVRLINWPNNRIPSADCGPNCLPGTYRVNSTSIKCRWSCETCPLNSVSSSENQYKCTICPELTISKNRTLCVNLHELKLHINRSEGLLIAIASAVGGSFAMIVLVLFIIYWNTPLVKSSNREMSVIQLLSIMGLFCLIFLHYINLTRELCMIRTYLFGFLFTTVLALVFIKTFRLLRVFNGRFTLVSRFLKTKFQIAFSFLLALLEVLVIFMWYTLFPAEVFAYKYQDNLHFCYVCKNEIIWGILIYNFVFAIACGYMAFRARKLPENFNEAQYISYAMFTVCIIWVSYLPLYISLKSYERQVAFLCINLASSYCTLIILFIKKVIIILFYPHLNNHCLRNTAPKTVLLNFTQNIEQKNGSFQSYNRNVVMFSAHNHAAHDPSNLLPLMKTSTRVSADNLNYEKLTVNSSSTLPNEWEECTEQVPLNLTESL